MNKQKVGIVFGGQSTEHDVSIVSATSIIENLDKNKYEIFPLYVSSNGEWFNYTKNIEEITILKIGEKPNPLEKIVDVFSTLKQCDVVFPVLHGLGGEDGSIQGLFQILGVHYVGNGILSSSVGMDKVYTKLIFEKAGMNQAPYEYIQKVKGQYIYIDKNFNKKDLELVEICQIIENKLKYPMFIKPSNSGSSVGINKAMNKKELQEYIQYASKFDYKILIEQGILGKECECAVLGNENVMASCIGEIMPADDFYSFDAKYTNEKSIVKIPAEIDEHIASEIKKIAIKAFESIDGKGLARVDFFVEKGTNKIYINEINTMPGFTKISMYPKLMEQSGIKYSNLLDKLIELAIE